MKTIEFTVVYPVTFRMEVPDDLESLDPDGCDKIKNDILDKADMLFGNDSAPVIQSAHEVLENGEIETDNLNFFTEL